MRAEPDAAKAHARGCSRVVSGALAVFLIAACASADTSGPSETATPPCEAGAPECVEETIAEKGELGVERGLGERRVVCLVDQDVIPGGDELGDPLPLDGALGKVLARVLDPDHGNCFRSSPLDCARDVLDDALGLPSRLHEADLHVDDDHHGLVAFTYRCHCILPRATS